METFYFEGVCCHKRSRNFLFNGQTAISTLTSVSCPINGKSKALPTIYDKAYAERACYSIELVSARKFINYCLKHSSRLPLPLNPADDQSEGLKMWDLSCLLIYKYTNIFVVNPGAPKQLGQQKLFCKFII